jgi:hypothetical protein
MGLSLVGTLPVSALNIGLVAAIPGLTQQIIDLQVQIGGLSASFAAQAEVGLNIPDLPTLIPGISAQLTSLPGLLLPTNWVTVGAAANLDLVVKLGLVELQLGLIGQLLLSFEAGLSAGSLSFWSYTGPAAGFGQGLAAQTAGGWGATGPDAQVGGLVIATESGPSWSIFGENFRIGSSRGVTASPQARRLVYEGVFNGGQLNTGVLAVKIPLDLYLLELQGLAVSLAFQIQVSLGLNLPSLSALAGSLEVLLPSLVLDNLINVKVNLAAEITALTVQVQFLLDLVASLQISLSAGGLTFWGYSGAASSFGAGLRDALTTGMPGGSGPNAPIYGLAIACEVPALWAAFGQIFKTS